MNGVYHVCNLLIGGQWFDCWALVEDGTRQWYKLPENGTPIPCDEPSVTEVG